MRSASQVKQRKLAGISHLDSEIRTVAQRKVLDLITHSSLYQPYPRKIATETGGTVRVDSLLRQPLDIVRT